MINIQINDESIRTAVSAAILQQLSADSRDAILQQAVTYLITPPADTYGRTKLTPLQVAMNEAVAEGQARDLIDKTATATLTLTGVRINHECPPPNPLSLSNPLARGGIVATHNPVIRED